MNHLKVSYIFLLLIVCIIYVAVIAQGESPPGGAALFDSHRWIPIEDTINYDDNLPQIVSNSWHNSDASIFIGISHFRDRRCAMTLKNIFTKAKYPNRIRVGMFVLSNLNI